MTENFLEYTNTFENNRCAKEDVKNIKRTSNVNINEEKYNKYTEQDINIINYAERQKNNHTSGSVISNTSKKLKKKDIQKFQKLDSSIDKDQKDNKFNNDYIKRILSIE